MTPLCGLFALIAAVSFGLLMFYCLVYEVHKDEKTVDLLEELGVNEKLAMRGQDEADDAFREKLYNIMMRRERDKETLRLFRHTENRRRKQLAQLIEFVKSQERAWEQLENSSTGTDGDTRHRMFNAIIHFIENSSI